MSDVIVHFSDENYDTKNDSIDVVLSEIDNKEYNDSKFSNLYNFFYVLCNAILI